MSISSMFRPYIIFLLCAFGISFFASWIPAVRDLFTADISGFYLTLALLLFAGYGIKFIAPKTGIPLYVWALLLGIALQVPLHSFVTDHQALFVVVELLATFVLFAGGIHVPVKNFKHYFAPIAALSFVGTLFTILFFAFALSILMMLYGFSVSALSLLLLAAILSSIDPTTIIPTLDHLHFRKPFLRDIAVTEGAVNDVVGVVVTRFFLIAALGATAASTLSENFTPLLSQVTLGNMALEIIWGIMIGFLGAWILKTWGMSVGKHHWSDHALFFIVPFFCFALGSLFGGAGFVAAFVAGLLFESEAHIKSIHVLFENSVDGFMKPIAFILLGALVPLTMFMNTMVIGALAALVFMFAVRPFVVFISLAPWMLSKRSVLTVREVLFLSFMRETGTIPAILLLYVVAAGFVNYEFILALGVWIILYTLIIEPPLIPLLAERLKVTKK